MRISTTMSATIVASRRMLRSVSMRSVSACVVSSITRSLRVSAVARSFSSYSSASRACRRSTCGLSHNTSGFSSISILPATR